MCTLCKKCFISSNLCTTAVWLHNSGDGWCYSKYVVTLVDINNIICIQLNGCFPVHFTICRKSEGCYIFLIHASLGIYEVQCVFVDNQGCEHVFFVAPDEIPILVEVEESMCVYMAINLGIWHCVWHFVSVHIVRRTYLSTQCTV